MKKSNEIFDDFINICDKKFITKNYNYELNEYLFNSYKDIINSNKIQAADIETFISNKKYILNDISNKGLLYKQPIIFLLYYILYNYPNSFMDQWPYTQEDVNPIYTDLGISNNY